VSVLPAARPLAVAGRTTTGRLTRTSARLLGILGALVILGVVVLASLALGSRDLDPVAVVQGLVAPDGSLAQRIVTDLRLPRTVVGLGVGMALGTAGLLMQGLTRNPIADPGILGVSAGASFAVVLSIRVLGTSDPATFIWFAIAGAALATLLVHLLSRGRRRLDDPVRLVLAGAVVSMLLQAGVSAVLVNDVDTLDRYRFWTVGSLSDADPAVLGTLLPLLLLGGVIAFLATRSMDALALGDDVARSLGARVGLVRVAVSMGIVLLTASAVVLAGPIVFVGLVVPHVARTVVGPDHRWALPYCLIGGAILVVAADTIGRLVVRPAELPVGVMTALIGAPVLILMVRRRSSVAP
jgi:iron complex transport system permease protein